MGSYRLPCPLLLRFDQREPAGQTAWPWLSKMSGFTAFVGNHGGKEGKARAKPTHHVEVNSRVSSGSEFFTRFPQE